MPSLSELNPRQRCYLLAAYQVDQANEKAQKAGYLRGRFERPKAAQWRPMPYGLIPDSAGPVPTMLRAEIERLGEVDEGSGATWAALARRGFVTVKMQAVTYLKGFTLPHITMTPKGRKEARALLGENGVKKPQGALSRATWKALAAGYKAARHGLWDERGGDWYGGVSGDMWLMLTRRQHNGETWFIPIQRQTEQQGRHSAWTQYEYGVQITDEGRSKYAQAWEVNSALHPDIDAPRPL